MKMDDELVLLERDLREALGGLRLPAASVGLQRRAQATSTSWRTNTSARPAPSRLIAVTALAAVIVLAVAALGLPYALSTRESRPATSPNSSRSPSSVATGNSQLLFSAADGSSILADGQSIAWQNVAMTQFGQPGSKVLGVVAAGSKVVMAVNAMTGTNEKGWAMVPKFFETTDGSSWTAIPVAGDPFANLQLGNVVGTSNGLVAIAQDLAAGSSVVLTSGDGRTWQRLPSDPFAPHVDRFWATSGPKGILVWGYLPMDGQPAGSSVPLVCFHSNDAVNWVSSTISGEFGEIAQAGGGTGEAPYWPVVEATADGFVVVSVTPTSPGAWFSGDGVTWAATTSAPDKVGPSLGASGSAAGKGGMAAILLKKLYRAGVQGEDWQPVGVGSQMLSTGWVAGDGDRMIIVGGKNVDWSTDGITWHRGTSTTELPVDSGVFSPNHQAWLVGSLVLVLAADGSTLYVGHVEG